MNDMPTHKKCFGPCQLELPLTFEFYAKHVTGKYGFQSRCRRCNLDAQKAFRKEHPENKAASDKRWQETNPEKVKANHFKHRKTPEFKRKQVKNWLEHKYGLTEEDYQTLWNKQDGLCAICGKPESITKRLHVDHCHDSKVVRGLLCGKCNRGIGMFDDSKILLSKAIEYLGNNRL